MHEETSGLHIKIIILYYSYIYICATIQYRSIYIYSILYIIIYTHNIYIYMYDIILVTILYTYIYILHGFIRYVQYIFHF